MTAIDVPDDVVFRSLGEEAILLHLGTGRYYGLDPVATRMWLALTEESGLGDACDRLLAEFEVEPRVLRRDLEELVYELAERRLVRPHERSAAPTSP